MTNAGLLSVIVPVYNVETYLNQCISSIINQTYENLEILLIDDGSTDRSGMICDQYAVKDTRIRVVHQENQGLSGARNVGTDLAQGQYVAYVDSDDWLDIHMYDELLRILQKHKLDMVRCAAFFSDGEKKEILSPKKEFQNQLFINEDVFKRYFDEFLCKVVWNAVYKKDIVKGILSPERCHSQDNYVSGMYLYRSKRMMIIDKPLYYYRQNPQSITRSGNRRPLDICICTNKLIHDLQADGFSDTYFLHLLYKKLARELFHFVRATNDGYKIKSMKDKLYCFISENLSFRRRLEFKYLIKSRNIKVIAADSEEFLS